MSPANRHEEFEQENLGTANGFDERRGEMAQVTRSPVYRTKRIRSARRSNSVNGMQRRRNKRIDW
jgi:hypothetical protein